MNQVESKREHITSLLLSAEDLTTELNALGVPFLTGGKKAVEPALSSADLLAGLAQNADARVQLALIPLLLVRPDYANFALKAKHALSPGPRLLFMCYYTAALLLQQKYADNLHALLGEQPHLSDLFCVELEIPLKGESTFRLQKLSQRQCILSGEKLNWLATYEHAAQRLISRLERERAWLS